MLGFLGRHLVLRWGQCLRGHLELLGLWLGVSMNVHVSGEGLPLSASATV